MTVMNNRSAAPIFVVGDTHSGTTMMVKVLSNSPAIFTGKGETRFFAYLSLTRQQFADLSDPETHEAYVRHMAKVIKHNYMRGYMAERGEESVLGDDGITAEQMAFILQKTAVSQSHIEIFCLIFEAFTELTGKARWLEKTPAHLHHIDKILRHVPNAKIISMVRDPRDVLASKQQRRKKEIIGRSEAIKKKVGKLQGGYDPLWDSLAWRAAYRQDRAMSQKHPNALLTVQYEQLVNQPEQVVQQICAFLDLPYSPDLLDIPWTNTTNQSAQTERGITNKSVGKGVRLLPPEHILLSQLVCRSEMKKADYSVMKVGWSAWFKLPLLLWGSGGEFVQRLRRRRKFGGNAFVGQVLRGYLRRLSPR